MRDTESFAVKYLTAIGEALASKGEQGAILSISQFIGNVRGCGFIVAKVLLCEVVSTS